MSKIKKAASQKPASVVKKSLTASCVEKLAGEALAVYATVIGIFCLCYLVFIVANK